MNTEEADICYLDDSHVSSSHQQKTPWTEIEDQIVRDAIDQGMTKWSEIARRFAGSRTGKQCRERWFNQLNPQLKRTPWTDREDTLLLKAHSDFGNCWKRISQDLTGRSENEIKNRFYSAEIKRKMESQCVAMDQFPINKKCKQIRSSTNSTNSTSHPTPPFCNVKSDIPTSRSNLLLRGERWNTSSPISSSSSTTHQSQSTAAAELFSSPSNQSSSGSKRRYSRDSSSTVEFQPLPTMDSSTPRHHLHRHNHHGVDEELFNSINAHRNLIASEEDFLAYAVAEIYLFELRKFSPDSRKKTLEKESGKWSEVATECFQSFSPYHDKKGHADQTLYSNTLDTDDNFSEYSTSSSLIHLTISEDNQVSESVVMEGAKINSLRNKFPSPKDGVNGSGVNSSGTGDHHVNKPSLLIAKGKTKPSPPFRPCGRGAMQLSKAISQSQSKSILSNSSSEGTATNWVFCFGNPPCYAKVLAFPSNNNESVYIQPMKQSPFDNKLLTLWEGHTWLAKQNKLISVEMVQKPGGWQVVDDSRVQKIIEMVDNKGCAFAYPTNINHAANTGIDKCDMISLESSEVGEMNVVYPLLPNQNEKNSSQTIGEFALQTEKLPLLIGHNNYSSSMTSTSASHFPMESFSRPKLRRPNHNNNVTKVHLSTTVSALAESSTILPPTSSIPVVGSSADNVAASLLALSQIPSNIRCIESQIMSQYDLDVQHDAESVGTGGELPHDGSAAIISDGGGDESNCDELPVLSCGGGDVVMNSQESFQSPNVTIGAAFHNEVRVAHTSDSELSSERPKEPEIGVTVLESSVYADVETGDSTQIVIDEAAKKDVDVEVEYFYEESSQLEVFTGAESEEKPLVLTGNDQTHAVESKVLFSPMCSIATATTNEVTDHSTSFVSTDDYEEKIAFAEEGTPSIVEMEVCASAVEVFSSPEDHCNSILSPESSARTARESEPDEHSLPFSAEKSAHSHDTCTNKEHNTLSSMSISESASASSDSVIGSPDLDRDTTTSVGDRRSSNGKRTTCKSSSGTRLVPKRRQSTAAARVAKNKRSNSPAEVYEQTAVVETASGTNRGKKRRVVHGEDIPSTPNVNESTRTKRPVAVPKYAVLGSWPSSKQCAASGNWFIR